MNEIDHTNCRKSRINGEPYTLLCDHMNTKWEEQFNDKFEYLSVATKFHISGFIADQLEKLINDAGDAIDEYNLLGKELKQQLRKKYL